MKDRRKAIGFLSSAPSASEIDFEMNDAPPTLVFSVLGIEVGESYPRISVCVLSQTSILFYGVMMSNVIVVAGKGFTKIIVASCNPKGYGKWNSWVFHFSSVT